MNIFIRSRRSGLLSGPPHLGPMTDDLGHMADDLGPIADDLGRMADNLWPLVDDLGPMADDLACSARPLSRSTRWTTGLLSRPPMFGNFRTFCRLSAHSVKIQEMCKRSTLRPKGS